MKTFIVFFVHYHFSVSSNMFIIQNTLFWDTSYQVFFVPMFEHDKFYYSLKFSLVVAHLLLSSSSADLSDGETMKGSQFCDLSIYFFKWKSTTSLRRNNFWW